MGGFKWVYFFSSYKSLKFERTQKLKTALKFNIYYYTMPFF